MNDTTTLTAPEKLDVRMPDTGMLIGAHRVAAGDGRTIEVEDPATGKIIAHVPAGGAQEVDAAVTAARTAFESRAWSRMRPLDRAKIIETIARKIEENAAELALLESYDNGKAVHHALAVDVPAAVDIFRLHGRMVLRRSPVRSTRSRATAASITPIRCASPSAWSARSFPGITRWPWRPGRSQRHWRQAARLFSSPPR
jgi:delta 1-pyrroline-5-carboxylate dehydrogenase